MSSSGVRDTLRQLTRSRSESEALDLIQDSVRAGAQCIDSVPHGVPVTLCGRIRATTLRPAQTCPAVEIDLYDGSGHLAVIWLGRRRIRGIEPGRTIVVHGRVTAPAGVPTMYNPRYELQPGSSQ